MPGRSLSRPVPDCPCVGLLEGVLHVQVHCGCRCLVPLYVSSRGTRGCASCTRSKGLGYESRTESRGCTASFFCDKIRFNAPDYLLRPRSMLPTIGANEGRQHMHHLVAVCGRSLASASASWAFKCTSTGTAIAAGCPVLRQDHPSTHRTVGYVSPEGSSEDWRGLR